MPRKPHPRFQFTAIELGNFRGFKNSGYIPVAPITYVVGPNSAGKSSLFDAFLFAAQSRVFPLYRAQVKPTWIGPLVDLGSFSDAVYKHNTEQNITIGFEIKTNLSTQPWRTADNPKYIGNIFFELTFRTTRDDPVGYLRSVRVTDKDTMVTALLATKDPAKPTFVLKCLGQMKDYSGDEDGYSRHYDWAGDQIKKIATRLPKSFSRQLRAGYTRIANFLGVGWWVSQYVEQTQRVASGRAGPRRWYPVTGGEETVYDWRIGQYSTFNEVTPASLSPLLDEKRERNIRGKRNLRRTGRRIDRINAMLSKLNIASKLSADSLSPYHAKLQVKDNLSGIDANIIDVGFGASQILPVLYACTADEAGPLFVEQPEIHLHPKAQGEIAELLLDTATRRQVFIETHSVHLINRARLRILRGKLEPQDVVVLYIDKTLAGSRVHTIRLDKNGDFVGEWPDGFFDERYSDTKEMLRLKADREEDES